MQKPNFKDFSEDQVTISWRPFPCENCSRRQTPFLYLARNEGVRPAYNWRTIDSQINQEVAVLNQWIHSCPHTEWLDKDVYFLAKGSEHSVYYDPQSLTVIKTAHEGSFGQTYCLEDGKIAEITSTPQDYLLRLHLWSACLKIARSHWELRGVEAS